MVLVLLPGEGPRQSAPTTRIDASDALSAAGATVRDVQGFCTREPNACTVGEEVATAIGYRAQAGAKMLYQLLRGALAARESAAPAADVPTSGSGKSAPERASQTTLTPGDLTPAWRGPPAPKDNKHSA
jgi:hypothetical protein